MASVAGALGLTALLRGRRGAGDPTPQSDDVGRGGAGRRSTNATVGRGSGRVVIVIAAYNEAEGIPAVLADPARRRRAALHADVVVVDDGSTDGTAEAALAARRGRWSSPCRSTAGRGQRSGSATGSPASTGRRTSSRRTPTGSTTLGDIAGGAASRSSTAGPTSSPGRASSATSRPATAYAGLGVHVFAWLASVLTGRRFTDTSFGLRAMRAEVTGAVTLNQPQYQSSELLVGVRLARLPGAGGAGPMQRPLGGAHQEGSQPGLRAPLRRRHDRHLVARGLAAPGQPRRLRPCATTRDHGRSEQRADPVALASARSWSPSRWRSSCASLVHGRLSRRRSS